MNLPLQPHGLSVPKLWVYVCQFSVAAVWPRQCAVEGFQSPLYAYLRICVYSSPFFLYESDPQTELCLFGFLQNVHAFLSGPTDDVNGVFSLKTPTVGAGHYTWKNVEWCPPHMYVL